MAVAPKLVEIDEAELINLQNVHGIVNEMLSHPEARKQLLMARKTANPKVAIPEVDAAAPINQALESVRKEMADWREQQAKDKAERDAAEAANKFQAEWEKKKQLLREQGWRDDGIAEIEKHAHDRGIPDLEVAAAHYEKLHPPSEPVTPNGFGSWDFFDPTAEGGENFIDKLMQSRGEDEGAVRQESQKALQDFRASVNTRR